MSAIAETPHRASWSSRGYTFTSNWFDANVPHWARMLSELGFVGRPDLKYLEIGVFEGESLCWMLENVLTHPSSSATAIDVVRDRELLQTNLTLSGAESRVTVLYGWSRFLLRSLPCSSFDIVYVDGGHHSADVFLDLALTWDLLKADGLLLMDDYLWGTRANNKWPVDVCPKPTIDLFLMAFANQVQVLRKDYQVAVRKKERHPAFNFVRLGPFEFYWFGGLLVDTRSGERIALTDEEGALLTRFCRTLRVASKPDDPANPVLREAPFVALMERLGIAEFGHG